MIQVESFYNELSPIIAKYKDYLLEFSRGTQCSKTSLWRWLNKINKNLPDPNKLLSVLEKDSGLRGKGKIAKFYGGEISKYIIKSFPLFFSIEIKEEIAPEEMIKIKDFYSLLIINICGTIKGATEIEIIELIGNVAARKSGFELDDLTEGLIYAHGKIARNKIQEILNEGLIFKDSEGYFHLHEKNIDLTSLNPAEFTGELISSFLKPEEYELGNNALFHTIETVSKKGANLIAQLQKKSFMECHKIMDEFKDVNGIPISVINFCERIQFTSLKKEGVLL